MSEHHGWADLPEGLLHSVVALSGSFSDLFAFSLTCRSWRTAFSSYPSKATFSTLLPPLLLQPDVAVITPCHLPFAPKRPCRVTDLASQRSRLRCQIPLGSFCFTGASYGQLIFSSNGSCLLVDVFTGLSVSPPQLPDNNRSKLYYGALTAPLASPNSHLLVSTSSRSFFWRVGSLFWRSSCNETIKQIVTFKGQLFGTDSGGRLFTLHLTPQIRIHQMAGFWGESTSTGKRLVNLCLVACGDMLILIRSRGSFPARGDTFEALRLDQSTDNAKFVKVEELGNWAIFISTDERSQPLSLMNPERWGGKSNCIYCYSHDSEHWTAFELGKPASDPSIFVFISSGGMVQPMWVVPSMFFSRCL
ncbi:uncharacterized protein LOC100835489 isoform X1 [Brachypodium distachyon]|uniref:KIB1-4 beta-propeller domain-containing protein n=1 Tax=Brachypodium distachyon TaxID=15368 RepID=I1H1E7_BRADI|nr:uncharacterized protein LOC100835489 isoform X1 [Brachypodium distachyon]KQK19782.1 hypothetical protein BRADI_1g50426v3 [Brachypodium distachyon]|eukprot:XP_003561155.1 uncharacterized protein LOC100835489 isoform X1 [Brachypodium distachyon]